VTHVAHVNTDVT